ncbi:glycerol-3-phosphate-acyltransferase, putative [Babesia bigemina]|uniref:Glycerol-3-phosphate-acyltransferase, putative n=1 Tax=Babesia bigemina TaxID=5866 RepID=A0A061D771_BABBI|nr:glycerol-3-phosphate-acyltransferase, putative [Babesia bigemina]CDR95807.1 glycerol-3-phosphate-acyltransferase, putative [Babesia bigemina]|eukprot:XP_012767993.1 glycerol-3-phosphate-acyltransferase, putative [Babesia bigemina]
MQLSTTDFRVFNFYMLIKWLTTVIIRTFFMKVTVINEERLPLFGPVILVGNHNNQFIDAATLIYAVPRQISFLVAMKSLGRRVIGSLARLAGCIPVHRQEDLKYMGIGKIHWKHNDTMIRGMDTQFTMDLNVGDKLYFIDQKLSIEAVHSDTELTLQRPISRPCKDEENGEDFWILPKVDLSDTYEAVSTALRFGNSIAIFPEGGSHDRTNLLPLKPGVVLMAIFSLLEGAEDVVILPVGLAYGDSHGIQSNATVYYGTGITISKRDVEEFQVDRYTVVNRILGVIEKGLNDCMITAPNKNIKGWIDLCGSLYPPERSLIPTNKKFELRKILSTIFWRHGEDANTIALIAQLARYKAMLKSSFLHDDEVWLLRQSMHSATLLFLEQLLMFGCYSILGLSCFLLWFPLYVISWVLAENHRKQALKNSVVKLEGADVVASYKILVLMVITPLFNLFYGLMLGLYLSRNPKEIAITVGCCMAILPILYYINLRYFNELPLLLRQLRVFYVILMGKINVWRENERELITTRAELQLLVREFVHEVGPKVSDTFMDELNAIMPKVMIDADTSRLRRSKSDWVPIFARTYYSDSNEEIL